MKGKTAQEIFDERRELAAQKCELIIENLKEGKPVPQAFGEVMFAYTENL